MRWFKITPEEFGALLEYQGVACALCGSVEHGGRNWNIDHDHDCCQTKKSCGQCIRGLLCASCNGWRLPAYENGPEHLKDSPLVNGYLADPPYKRWVLELEDSKH
ncbi:endonuclease domain-containing protein [Streptomyces sp. NPDC002730]|uniref:endonuclease domain-containing protein n=1 Tax=Streptomyces sp. NPDC002730 TaxID=3364662 RepID=UPI0036BB757E